MTAMRNDMHAVPEWVMDLSVFDTHTHLDTSENVAASDVWDILHYFWFLRELQAAGYPAPNVRLSKADRRDAFLSAFERSRNTYWNTIVRRMLADLFECRLETPGDFDLLEEKIASTACDPDWPAAVCDRILARNIVVGADEMDVDPSFAERLVVVPYFEIPSGADEAPARIHTDLNALLASGYRTIRVELEPLLSGRVAPEPSDGLENRLYHAMLAELDRAGTRVQVFCGMKRDTRHHTMLNDPQRIVRLYPLFDRYSSIQFEFVNAAAGNNLDIVQAARVFTNVHPGGLWWFNFRASSYRDVFQQRFEALPALRSSIVASDARCIEWLYGKVLFVKTVLAQFLQEQIERGWTDAEGARRVAEYWLSESARSGYGR